MTTQAEQFCKDMNAAHKLPSGQFDNAMLRALNRYNAANVARIPGLYVMGDGSKVQYTGPNMRVGSRQPFQVVVS